MVLFRHRAVPSASHAPLDIYYSALECAQISPSLQEHIATRALARKDWQLARALVRHPSTDERVVLQLTGTARADLVVAALSRSDCPPEVVETALNNPRRSVQLAVAGHDFSRFCPSGLGSFAENSHLAALRVLLRNESAPANSRLVALRQLASAGQSVAISDVCTLITQSPELALAVAELNLSAPVAALASEFCDTPEHVTSALVDYLVEAVGALKSLSGPTPFRDLLVLNSVTNAIVYATRSRDESCLRARRELEKACDDLTSPALVQELATLSWKLVLPRFDRATTRAALMAKATSREEFDTHLRYLTNSSQGVPALAVKAALESDYATYEDVFALASLTNSSPSSWVQFVASPRTDPTRLAALLACLSWLGPDALLSRSADPEAVLACALARPNPSLSLAHSRYLTPELVPLAPVRWILSAPAQCHEWAWGYARSQLGQDQWSTFATLAESFDGSWREAVLVASAL